MSVTKLLNDIAFGEKAEDTVITLLREQGWTEIEKTGKMNVHDYRATNSEWTKFSLELKTRKCTKEQYEDTLIGANKMAKAYELFYKEGIETLFLFSFTNGLFYLNPFDHSPRREYKLQRFDRGGVDSKKWWLYYDTTSLKEI